MKKTITNKYGPNTTILLPGSCNAKCDFCFWNRDEGKIRVGKEVFLEKAFTYLANMPDLFSVLSISGGEPTLSPYFSSFLVALSRFRRDRYFERVVLTTNGANLDKHIAAVGCAVDHINISRHGLTTEENQAIFKTESIPTDEDLKRLISRIHKITHCDVTLNCVIPEDGPNNGIDTFKFCRTFIKYAKDLGADAVSFRKVASDVSPTMAEKMFAEKYGVDSETQCPVCRGMNQIVDGYDVRWKGTVNEPSLDTHGIYEVIIHPDGNGYVDWGMTMPVSTETLAIAANKFQHNAESDSEEPEHEPRKGSTLMNPIAMHEHLKTLAEQSISKPKKHQRKASLNFSGKGYSGGCGSGGCGGGGRSGCGGGC